MIVVMEKGASRDQIDHMVQRVEGLGLKAHVIVGTERTVIAAIGEKRSQMKESLESGPGVAEVVPILAPYKVASREVKAEPTQVVAGSLKVGAGVIGVMAGPCSVESEEQILSSARAVKAAGLKLYVYTVNDPAVAKRMVEYGVDGITTDRPGWLRERLGK